MKTLQISAAYLEQSGGVAVHVHDLVNNLVRENDIEHVDVICSDENRKEGDIIQVGKGQITEWKCPSRSIESFSGRRLFQEEIIDLALRKLTRKNIDIIHAHDWDSLYIGWVLAKVWNVPLILTAHRAPETWYRGRPLIFPKDGVMEAIKRSSILTRIIVPSIASKKVLQDQGFRNLKVIPHGIPKYLSSFNISESILKKYQIPEGRTIILCPVRAEEHKDPQILVRAAPEIIKNAADQCNPLFVFLSDWKGKDIARGMSDLKSAAKNRHLGNENVIFLPQIRYGSELASIFKKASIIVVPSVHESFGLSVLDAFACRRPVVARNSMALPEIIKHERNGLLFDDSKDLASHINRLLEDADLVSALVNQASEDLNTKYSINRMIGEYLSLYRSEISAYKNKKAA